MIISWFSQIKKIVCRVSFFLWKANLLFYNLNVYPDKNYPVYDLKCVAHETDYSEISTFRCSWCFGQCYEHWCSQVLLHKTCIVHFFAKLISSNSKSSSYCFDKYFTIPKGLFSSYYLLFSLLPMKAIYEASKRNQGKVISFQYIHKGLEWIKNIRCRNCVCSVYRWFWTSGK